MKAAIVLTGKLNKELLKVSYVDTDIKRLSEYSRDPRFKTTIKSHNFKSRGDFIEIENTGKAEFTFNDRIARIPIGTFALEIMSFTHSIIELYHDGGVESVTYYNYKSSRRPLIHSYNIKFRDEIVFIRNYWIRYVKFLGKRCGSSTYQNMRNIRKDMKTGMYEIDFDTRNTWFFENDDGTELEYYYSCKEEIRKFGEEKINRCIDLFTLLL